MARYTKARCRLCRRQGMKLFLKGTRCSGPSCAFNKRNYPPGQHGQMRVKLSDYGVQLHEKQKLKFIYGLTERSFRLCFQRAAKSTGVTGEVLFQILETRLDNVIFRARFASSRSQARQIVSHGHVFVDGRKVNVSSCTVKPNQKIELKGSDVFVKQTKERVEQLANVALVEWLAVDEQNLSLTVTRLPERKDVSYPIKEQLVVELYSK